MTELSRDHMTLGEAIERLTPPRRPAGSLSSDSHHAEMSWDLGAGFDRTVELARDGWRDKAAELEQLMVQIAEVAPEGFSFHRDVSGECVDVGAFLAGEPECMTAIQPPRARHVALVVNISARASASAELLLHRGIAIASVVYSLQAAGYGVSLKVAEWVRPSNGAGPYHETFIEVNQSGEYIDPARLAFWLAHPAALRRCIFRYNEQCGEAIRDRFGFHDGGGYGFPSNPPAGHLFYEGALTIPFPETSDLQGYRTPRDALRSVGVLLAQQGFELRAAASLD